MCLSRATEATTTTKQRKRANWSGAADDVDPVHATRSTRYVEESSSRVPEKLMGHVLIDRHILGTRRERDRDGYI